MGLLGLRLRFLFFRGIIKITLRSWLRGSLWLSLLWLLIIKIALRGNLGLGGFLFRFRSLFLFWLGLLFLIRILFWLSFGCVRNILWFWFIGVIQEEITSIFSIQINEIGEVVAIEKIINHFRFFILWYILFFRLRFRSRLGLGFRLRLGLGLSLGFGRFDRLSIFLVIAGSYLLSLLVILRWDTISLRFLRCPSRCKSRRRGIISIKVEP